MGIGNLMKAFAQYSSDIFDWLVTMTAKFREWSEQVGKSQGFKKFVQYVQENGPVIMDLIGNIVKVFRPEVEALKLNLRKDKCPITHFL